MSGLCTPGEASASVKSNTTAKQDTAAGASGTASQYVYREQHPAWIADAPDFSDTLIQEARKRMAMQLSTQSDRRQALANNPGMPAAAYSLLGSA